MLTNKIDKDDTTTSELGTTPSRRAVAALIVVGGPQLLASIKAIKNHATLPYSEIRAGLDLEYKTASAR